MTSPNTRDVRLNIKVDADDRGTTKVSRGLDDTARSADKAGGSLKRMGVDLKSLNADIAESSKRVAELRAHLLEVGNDKGVRKALRGEESWLRELTKIAAQVGATGAAIGGQTLGSTGGSTAGSFAGSPMGPAIAAVVGAALIPLAPAIGATVAGAVAGTIGTGGIAGGILMASKDARVKSSAAAFGDAISQEFFRGGEAFVGPTQESLRILGGAFKEMQVPEAFAKMAPHVTTIAQGFADLGTNVMPGLNKAFDRMGPLAAVAAGGIGDTGAALGDLMDSVTGSKGTVEGLQTAFYLFNGTIRGVGETLAWLGDRYDEALKFTDGFAMAFEDLPGMLGLSAGWARDNIAAIRAVGAEAPHFAGKVIEASNAITDVNAQAAQSWGEIRDRIQEATRAQDAYFNSAMAVPEANDALEASFDAFSESLKENGRTFDAGTEKGRANREAMRDLVQGAQDVRSAMIDQGQSVADANRKYDENIAKIEAIAAEAGITKDALLAMAGDYTINIYRKEITHKVTFFENHDVADTRKGDFRAAGGPVMAGVPYVINERGPETVTFPAAGTVHPANLTPMSGATNVTLSFRGSGSRFIDALISDLQAEVDKRGGDPSILGIRP